MNVARWLKYVISQNDFDSYKYQTQIVQCRSSAGFGTWLGKMQLKKFSPQIHEHWCIMGLNPRVLWQFPGHSAFLLSLILS